jgi:hypothetical protein
MAANIISYLQSMPGAQLTLYLSNGNVVEGMNLESNIDIIRIKLDDGRTDHIDPADLVHFTRRKTS